LQNVCHEYFVKFSTLDARPQSYRCHFEILRTAHYKACNRATIYTSEIFEEFLMRSSLLLLAFVSLPALACPNLAGNYKSCHSSSDPELATEIYISQKVVNKYVQFTFTHHDIQINSDRVEKYTADGLLKIVSDTDTDTGITIQTETQASCSGTTALNIKMKATLDNEEFANVTIKATKVGNKLIQVFSGTSMGEEVKDTIICE
jgi:hypothetical protein